MLDENVPIRAIVQKPGPALDLLRTLSKNCHHKLVASDVLLDKYKRELREHSERVEETHALLVSNLFRGLLSDSDKTLIVAGQESDIRTYVRHMNDHFLVDIADEITGHGTSGCCILVTTDEPTRSDFNEKRMEDLGCRGVTIEDGLVMAQEPD